VNKEWHENIPENGVLCKEKSSGSIVRIMGKSNLLDSMVVDDCRRRNHFGTDELTPLAAEEWWKFAPWMDMDSAPTGTAKFLGMLENGEIVECHIYKSGIIKNGDFVVKLIKWLPLPTGPN